MNTSRTVPVTFEFPASRRAADRSDKPEETPAEAADLELLALLMDSVFVIPGTNIRFGLDSIVGLIPGLGDAATSLVSLYLLGAASRRGISRATMARMGANIAVDFVVGAIPLVGDVFDVYWKSNQKNVELLRQRLAADMQASKQLEKKDKLFVGGMIAGLALLLVGSLAATGWLVVSLVRLLTS